MTWSKGGGGKGKQDYGGYRGWSYWRGATSPSNKQGKGWGKEPWQEKAEGKQAQPKKGAFPHCDALPKGERQSLVEVASSSSSGGYVSDLQRAVNIARKAEQRVKRLAGEKTQRVQQWKDYEAELKRCYAVEKQRFRGALQRLEKEEAEALLEQTTARESLRKVALGQESDVVPVPMEAPDQDFEMLTRSAFAEGAEEEDADAVIQRAVEAGKGPLHAAPSAEVPLLTPLGRTRVPAMTPDTTYSARFGSLREEPGLLQQDLAPTTAAVSDPYLNSPVLPSAPTPKPAFGHKEPVVRTGIKDAVRPKQPIHHVAARSSPSLAEKLEARRMQQMNAGPICGQGMEQVSALQSRAEREQMERERLGIPVQVPVLVFDDEDKETCWTELGFERKHSAHTPWGFGVGPYTAFFASDRPLLSSAQHLHFSRATFAFQLAMDCAWENALAVGYGGRTLCVCIPVLGICTWIGCSRFLLLFLQSICLQLSMWHGPGGPLFLHCSFGERTGRPCSHVLCIFAMKCHLETRLRATDHLCPLLFVIYNGAWLCPRRCSMHTAFLGIMDLLCALHLVIYIGAWWCPRHRRLYKWRNRATDPGLVVPKALQRMRSVESGGDQHWNLVVPMALHSIHLWCNWATDPLCPGPLGPGSARRLTVYTRRTPRVGCPGDLHWGLAVAKTLHQVCNWVTDPCESGPLLIYIGGPKLCRQRAIRQRTPCVRCPIGAW